MSLFGKPQTAKDVFGGAKQQTAREVFGGAKQPTAQDVFGGQPKSLFGDKSTASREIKPATHSLFGKKAASNNQLQTAVQNTNTVTAKSLFTNAASTQQLAAAPTQGQTHSLFGNKGSTSHKQSAFGGNASSDARSFFTAKAQDATKPQKGVETTLFGKSVGAGGADSSLNSRLYSQLTDLTQNELAAFSAPDFQLGCIPLKLPPMELCH